MKFMLENCQELDRCYFHDLELIHIECNYIDHEVRITLSAENNEEQVLVCKGVQFFSVDIFEPWGEGYYIAQVFTYSEPLADMFKLSDDQLITKGIFGLKMMMNSGDYVSILMQELLLEKN